MADIAATNVTVTLTNRDQIKLPNGVISMPQMTFGNGVLTYPANGIPLPDIGVLGDFKVGLLKGGVLEHSSGDGYVYKYDRANNKIRIWIGDNNNAADGPAVELGSVAVPATTLTLFLWGN